MYCEFQGEGWGALNSCCHDHSPNGVCPYYDTHAEHLCPLEGSPIRTYADDVREMTTDELEQWFWDMQKIMMHYTDSHSFVHDYLNADVRDKSLNFYFNMLKGDYIYEHNQS